jgi:hypothetical protein
VAAMNKPPIYLGGKEGERFLSMLIAIARKQRAKMSSLYEGESAVAGTERDAAFEPNNVVQLNLVRMKGVSRED